MNPDTPGSSPGEPVTDYRFTLIILGDYVEGGKNRGVTTDVNHNNKRRDAVIPPLEFSCLILFVCKSRSMLGSAVAVSHLEP